MTVFIQQWLTAWNSHDVEKLIAFYNEIFENETITENYSFNGKDSFRQMAGYFFQAYPDLQFDAVDTVTEGEKVAILWVAQGTHKGTFNHILPTGKKLEVNGVSFFISKNERTNKAAFLCDGADMLRQIIGSLPEIQATA